MNLPNKLTLTRIILVPVFMVFVSLTQIGTEDFNPTWYLVAGIIFAAASFTDFLDGHLARKWNMVTDFGKFADPLADKLLTTVAFIYMLRDGVCSPVVLCIILAREFAVSGLRMVAAGAKDGKVIAANMWGKVKTVLQMLTIIFYYFGTALTWGNFIMIGADCVFLSYWLCWLVAIATAISGIQKAMTKISNINVYGFAIFLIFLLVFSNASFLFNLSTESLGGFAGTFIERILITGQSADSQWPQWWTTFYWFSWMSWAPTSGAFMGRIAYGRKVKHMLGMYIGVCATVSAVWMMLVSGTSLWIETSGAADLCASYTAGTENVAYDMLGALPLSAIVIPLFVILIFLSTVTACNSNMIAMAGISTRGISPDNPDAPNWLKFVWGVIPMAVGYIMIASVGVNGVKIIANFGGMFAALIMIGAAASLGILIVNHKKYDLTIEGAKDEIFGEVEK